MRARPLKLVGFVLWIAFWGMVLWFALTSTAHARLWP